ncbi:MAG: choice-of-anchor D domain-containing protein, partial [Bryobacteraceae bacterium]
MALAQTTVPFKIDVEQQDGSQTVSNGTTINMGSSAVGIPLKMTVSLTYTGATTATISAAPKITGSNSFSVSSQVTTPINLSPNDTFTFDVAYTASDSSKATAQLQIDYSEASPSPGVPATNNSVQLGLAASAVLSFSYSVPPNTSFIQLSSTSQLLFPATGVNTPVRATVTAFNVSVDDQTVSSVSIAGDAFQLVALPLLPATIPSGKTLQFQVQYTATHVGTDTGTLTVKLGSHTLTIGMEGFSTGSIFSYQLTQGTTQIPIQPNQTVTLPDTAVGTLSSFTLQVRNTGNDNGQIDTIAVSGTSFSLADVPFLPKILAPNAVVTLTLNFDPIQAGPIIGHLRIGTDDFDLATNGAGGKLVYSYTAGSVTTVVQPPNTTVLFSPVGVGQSSTTQFSLRNDGTATANITTIGVTTGAYHLQNLPALPLSLGPGSSASFSIFFAPTATGAATAQLLVDTQQFTLSGFGSDPVPLPTYHFTGASSPLPPFQQPAIGLSLDAPYAVPINGTLT